MDTVSNLTTSEHSVLLNRIQALRDVIEQSSSSDEFATEVSAHVLHDLEEAGVFRLMVPACLGGLEAHPSSVIDVLKQLAYFDGSTGWHSMAVVTAVGVTSAFLGERAADAIFGSDKRGTCAGQVAPSGKAERVGDGYRISGSFSFGSGLPNADWVLGGYILHEDGDPVMRDGEPVMLPSPDAFGGSLCPGDVRQAVRRRIWRLHPGGSVPGWKALHLEHHRNGRSNQPNRLCFQRHDGSAQRQPYSALLPRPSGGKRPFLYE
nr:hypothetical protein [Dankookia rubra]